MASASYADDLICSVCLSLFTDPVSLSCGHSFCRGCLTSCLRTQKLCPCCRAPTAEENLSTNYIIKRMADNAKEQQKKKTPSMDEQKGGIDKLCPDHEEKLKLFCETDQQLACVICQTGEKHDGHKFKPIKEAALAKRQELNEAIQFLTNDISSMNTKTKQQEEEINKTETKSGQLTNQISSQFEEMHQFLRKREEEIMNELKEKKRVELEKMRRNLESMEVVVSERREKEIMLISAQDIPDSEGFLQWWNDRGLSELEELKDRDAPPEGRNKTTMKHPYRSRVDDLKVTTDSLSLGPYQSHLQFFVWKEMLQVIKDLPERLTLETSSKDLIISHDRRSVLRSHINATSASKGLAVARNNIKFNTGQHCWEVEVGNNMNHISTQTCDLKDMSPYFTIGKCDDEDYDPLMVCWY
ncbi:hypothetical protein UPYG_G00003810 [Umbra pygmaea]|uniref:Uncharacterized protein n=1 Tax=Umbra pygmaea TaxID=75934 RepID=A0ABD0XGZ9_UMBPY